MATPVASTNAKVVERSPFFQPSDPRKVRPMESPGGTMRMQKKPVDAENKSNILGASANLVVSIVGAGIVGIPYAMEQSGLVAGFVMIVVVAFMTEKSLRLLIETAKHIDVPSYETLFEACFGKGGFYSMCAIMFIMSYGAMVSYLMIMKDSIAGLLGVAKDDYPMKRLFLILFTAAIAFPLSAQRDMADLAKTSKVSVTFYFFIVSFILAFSPLVSTVEANGGLYETLAHSIYRGDTFFVGLGVLSFAFVCQHSAFILAGSLERPTNKRWSKVTLISLLFSGTLAIACGVAGYLGFLEETQGNILLNFKESTDPLIMRLNTVAYVMLLTCMFFVYPMDAFVLRHVCMVIMFKGRAAHEGNDHLVLARTDRRILLTLGIYIITLLPALLLEDLGKVLAVTGAVAGSSLSYICPGASYLAAHGSEFVKLIQRKWTWGNPDPSAKLARELEASLAKNTESPKTQPADSTNCICEGLKMIFGRSAYLLSLMPVWMCCARLGIKSLADHVERESLKSPALNKRLGKVAYKRPLSQRAQGLHTPDLARIARRSQRPHSPATIGNQRPHSPATTEKTSLLGPRRNSFDDSDVEKLQIYGGAPRVTAMGNRAIGAAIMKQQAAGKSGTGVAVYASDGAAANVLTDEEEPDTQADFPGIYDFVLAVFFVVFGFIAMIAGMYSILASDVGASSDNAISTKDSSYDTLHHSPLGG